MDSRSLVEVVEVEFIISMEYPVEVVEVVELIELWFFRYFLDTPWK